MPNMSYCRFTNTLADLRDCQNNMEDEDLSPAEQKAKESLIALCKRIGDDWSEYDEDDDA